MSLLAGLWPYRFISLSPEQIQERRELLDVRGNYAQISAAVYLLGLVVYASSRHTSSSSNEGKKRRDNVQSGQDGGATATIQGQKGVKSWMDSPPVSGWTETRRQYIVVLAWLGWILALSAWKTGNDYLHLTKSIGHTAFANIPIQILLSPKQPSPRKNPLLRLIGLSQTQLTPYHRLFGRLIISPLLTLHAILYLTFFAMTTDPVPLLPKRLQDADVQLGVTGVTILIVLWVTSSSMVGLGMRKKKNVSRETFEAAHVSLVMALLGVVYFHVRHSRKFVLEALGIYAVDIISAYWP